MISGIALYWGSFDPPTKAHLAVIRAAEALFEWVFVIVNHNNDSKKRYLASSYHRLAMMRRMLSSSKTKLFLQENKSLDYWFFKKIYALPLYVVAGEDAYQTWCRHCAREELFAYDGIYVVPRRQQNVEERYNIYCLPISKCYDRVSSKQVREQLIQSRRDKVPDLEPVVLNYILENDLYNI